MMCGRNENFSVETMRATAINIVWMDIKQDGDQIERCERVH